MRLVRRVWRRLDLDQYDVHGYLGLVFVGVGLWFVHWPAALITVGAGLYFVAVRRR